jgi:DNA-binding transcriptional regulator YhcF (GntR family)
MLDSVCKCFTGRISRLIDCLNGFDELVQINISDTEQIGQVISQIAINLESKNEYTVEKHKEYAIKELLERGYTKEVIKEWIQHIE